MKERILIILLAIVGYLPCFGSNHPSSVDEKKDVVLEKGNEDDPTKHSRTLTGVPLTCYSLQENIYLNALTDLGEICITIIYLGTGESWSYSCCSNSGIICIPASSISGNYMIEITTVTGDLYYGYYSI